MIPRKKKPPKRSVAPTPAVDAYGLVACWRQARLSGDVGRAYKILETLRRLAQRPVQHDADSSLDVEVVEVERALGRDDASEGA